MLESREKMPTSTVDQTEISKRHVVSVRNLVEFVLQSGDLSTGGFQMRDRAEAGTQGHKQVQRSRPEGYQAEVEIACQVEGADLPLEVRGRIDGLYVSDNQVIIEKIKTTTLSLELINEGHNRLHWAQAECYAYMYVRQHGLNQISIHLTYYHLDSRKEKTFERRFTMAELEIFFHDLITSYLDWFWRLVTSLSLFHPATLLCPSSSRISPTAYVRDTRMTL